MAVTVVQAVQGDTTSGSPTAALSNTPAGGDVLIVAFTSLRTTGARTVTSISGCGGTWSSAYSPGGRIEYWINTTANASGTVTVTMSGTGQATIKAYHLRGVSSTVSGSNTTTTGTSLAGTAISAGNGQIALFEASAMTTSSPSWPSSSTPSGWTATSYTPTGAYGGHAHRIPTEDPATNHTVTLGVGASVALQVTGLVVGTFTATATNAVVAATLPSLSSAVTATSTVTAASAASLPSLSSSVAVATTIPAASAATLPALSSAVTATSTATAAVAAALPSLSAEVHDEIVRVIEVSTLGGGSLGTTPAVTIATTPLTDDVLVVAIESSNTRTLSSVSGCGATWDIELTGDRVQFAVGTGANAAGAITATLSSSANGAMQVYVIRGLTSPTWEAELATGSDNPITGPTDSLTRRDIAIAALGTAADVVTAFSGTGYVVDHSTSGTGSYRAAHVVPAASGSFSTAGTMSSDGFVWRVGQIALRSIETPQAEVAASLPSLTSAVAVSVSVPASVPATLPSLTAAVAVTVDNTVAAAVAATLPSLSVAVDATSSAPSGDYVAASLPSLSASVVVDAGLTLEPWVSGASGEALLNLEPSFGVLEVSYPAAEAPPAIAAREVALKWQSHETATVGGTTAGMTSVDVGVPHVWVDGVDVTYFRDVPTKIGGWKTQSPFGWTTTKLAFPKVFHYEETGVGDLEWMRGDAPVEIWLVPEVGDPIHRFTGHLTSDDPGMGRGRTISEWGVEGALWQADHAHHPVPARLDPTDIGTLVPDELNGTPSRRFAPIARVTTGILDKKRGSTGQTRWENASDRLSTAIEESGSQWTIEPTGPRSFAMALKDTTTVHWTVTAGAPGVELDLSKDHHERIDAVYASGTGPDGYRWLNIFFPDLLPYDPPDYPYSDPDQNVLIGDTDADTLTGTGISDWQRRIRDLGYTSLPVDGVYNSADRAATIWIQRKRGIQVDGYLGPQTWAATWNIGAVGGDLTTIRLPMAWRPEVEPFLYGANGAVVGNNPDYDPSIIRHEVDIDFGAGVTKEQGRELAQRILERGLDPGWVGSIKLTSCPWEGSRWLIDAGANVLVKGFRGEDVLCRITDVDADPESLTVTLTVDSEFRDAMAVVQILNRNRESQADPARRPGNPSKRSRLDQDMVTPFEGESPAGRLPKMALFGGLWTVWPVPVSEIGEVARLRFRTSGPASRYCVAMFGKPITANQVDGIAPSPLSDSEPWRVSEEVLLDKYGWIDTWGKPSQAAGYSPGQETGPDAGSLTGKLTDDAGFPYVSQVPPWIWVAMWAEDSCYIEGRIYPAPVQ